jgi:3-oxoacyl-[acyl-carrier protein] reductase
VSEALDGKIALVTGGARGIGRAVALSLARAGAKVAVNHRMHEEDVREIVDTVRKQGGEAMGVRGDVSVPDDVAEVVARVTDSFGPIDVLVNNAGIARQLSLEKLQVATWDATMATNLRGPFLVTSAVLPDMRKKRWGRLIYISSTAARVGGIVGPHYTASKAGMEGLMRSYASLLAKEGITSNAVAPALIETEMLAGNPKASPDNIPVGRFGTVEEVADLVLAVVKNPYITGQTFQVNGGIYMT